MLERIEEFGQLLRKNGVRLSTGEIIDASRAVAAVGVDEPGRLRATLAACMVKRAPDLDTFHELFDLYFLRDAAVMNRDAAGSLDHIAARAESLDAPGSRTGEALARALAEGAMTLGPAARMGLGMRAPDFAALLGAASARIELDGIRSPLHVGAYAHRLGDALGLGQAEADALAMAAAAAGRAGLGDAAREALRAEILQRFGRLRQALRSYVSQALSRQNLDYRRELAISALADKPLAQLSEREIAELRRELARMARILRARLALRREHLRRGRLDLSRTLRRSLASGGVPFRLATRRRKPHKPRLLVLCDISDSVRNVSRFMLQLVYLLQELFERVHSFAFVADLGELTGLFRTHDIERAIELAYSGAVVSTFANSNYGRTLAELAARHMDKITPRTTVLVIGDGRTNYHPSRADILAALRRRARRVLWLSPEPPAAWGLGDSAMREYEPHCDRVMVARTLDGLRKAIDHLVT